MVDENENFVRGNNGCICLGFF
ncbi:MAG: hypothetical protein EAX95_13390 [Candidatus Thorarchaeota archaeon]|nr:hypothetical protein [Candidatus Thorarchaeota archaeon]